MIQTVCALQVKPTAAVYRVRDPLEVMSFLTSLVEWGKSEDNAWHQAKGCSGWRLNADSASLSPPSRGLNNDNASCSSQASGNPDFSVLQKMYKHANFRSVVEFARQ